MEKIYDAVNERILVSLPKTLTRVLDIGCGSGTLGARIKRNAATSCEVVGITLSEAEARRAVRELDEVILGDLNTLDLSPLGIFDCVICSHVLEHLPKPEALLVKYADVFLQRGAWL